MCTVLATWLLTVVSDKTISVNFARINYMHTGIYKSMQILGNVLKSTIPPSLAFDSQERLYLS